MLESTMEGSGKTQGRERALCAAGLVLPLLLLSIGCRQGNLYHASSLPPGLVAPPVGSVQNVDLSTLARSVGNNNQLFPGDLVEITISTGLEDKTPPNWRGRIGEDGAIDVPLVGKVGIAGQEITQAEQAIRAESIRRGKFVDPNVTVLLKERRSHRVSVVGAVEEPGTYEVPATSSDVLAALNMAGGPTDKAGTIIEVRHPASPGAGQPFPHGSDHLATHRPQGPAGRSEQVVRIDLEQIDALANADLHVEDGSTVMVRKRPDHFVHVIGLVRRAGQFEIPETQELRLLDALALAGGRDLSIADKVHVIRRVPGQIEPVVIEASIKEAKRGESNIRLAAGDVVSVEQTPLTLVVGTIRDFVGFGMNAPVPGL